MLSLGTLKRKHQELRSGLRRRLNARAQGEFAQRIKLRAQVTDDAVRVEVIDGSVYLARWLRKALVPQRSWGDDGH